MTYNLLAIYVISSIYGGVCLAFMAIGASVMSSSPNSKLFDTRKDYITYFGLAFIPVLNTLAVIGAPLWMLIYYRRGFLKFWYWLYVGFTCLILWSLYTAANYT